MAAGELCRTELQQARQLRVNATTQTYGFDDYGNQVYVWNYPSGPNVTYTHAATNRLTSLNASGSVTHFTYDNAGKMTAAGSTTYAWGAANRLKNVNGGALGSYGYDGNGKRVKKSESGTTTYYVISSVLGSALEMTSAGVQRAYCQQTCKTGSPSISMKGYGA